MSVGTGVEQHILRKRTDAPVGKLVTFVRDEVAIHLKEIGKTVPREF